MTANTNTQSAAKPSFMAAMRATFGLPNQTALDFGREIKDLSDSDRTYYSKLLNDSGIEHQPPAAGSVAAA